MYSNVGKFDQEQKIVRRLNIAKLFYQNKDYKSAKNSINELLELKPDCSDAYKLLSLICEAMGDNDQAIVNYQKSLEIKSLENSVNYYNDNLLYSPSRLLNKNLTGKNSPNPSLNSDGESMKNIENLIDSKLSVIINHFQEIRNLSEHASNNNSEMLSLKQELIKINNNIALLIKKQDALEKIVAAKLNDNLKNEYNELVQFCKDLSSDFKILSADMQIKFFDLSEKLDLLNEKNENDTDDGGDEEDISDGEHNDKFSLAEVSKVPLKDFFANKNNLWRCKVCDISNEESLSSCASCETPRFSVTEKQNILGQENSSPQTFKFPVFNNETVKSANILNTEPKIDFKSSFNTNKNESKNITNENSFNISLPATSNVNTFGTMNFNFNNQFLNKSPSNETTSSIFKPAVSFNFGSLQNTTPVTTQNSFTNSSAFPTSTNTNSSFIFSNFTFPSLSPQTSNDTKQPETKTNFFTLNQPVFNSPELENNNQLDGEQNDSSGDLILPKVNLPENYVHVTGEEDEEEKFNVVRAKLYILDRTEYKERGTGGLKILQNPQTKKYRLVMRRDQVHKVCLNTALTSDIKFDRKDDKRLLFQCIDFSDNTPSPQTLLLKFPDSTICENFKEFINNLFNDKTNHNGNINKNLTSKKSNASTISKKCSDIKKDDLNDDVQLVFVKEPKNSVHKSMVEKLKLPLNFYDYEEKSLCKGCIGCRVDEISWNDLTYSTIAVEDDSQKSNNLFLSSSFSMTLGDKVDTIKTADSLNTSSNLEDMHSFVSEKSKLLPEKYEHTTGEENEDVIYKQRAKLYRFVKESSEFKERGVGDMKILKNRNKNEYRLLMRRDIIFNVICNHMITSNLKLTENQKSLTTWTWGTIDYSESNAGQDEIFLIKFKDEEKKKEFFNMVEQCKQNI